MQRTRPKIDAALEAKIALKALRERATVADLTQRYRNERRTCCYHLGFLTDVRLKRPKVKASDQR
jgi:hypothetical protein